MVCAVLFTWMELEMRFFFLSLDGLSALTTAIFLGGYLSPYSPSNQSSLEGQYIVQRVRAFHDSPPYTHSYI